MYVTVLRENGQKCHDLCIVRIAGGLKWAEGGFKDNVRIAVLTKAALDVLCGIFF